jgi:peptide/nickel transport system permease protein
MSNLRRTFATIAQYPSAIIGVVIILALILLAIYAMIKIPYNDALRLWRGGEDIWYDHPRTALPVWYNYLTEKKLPPTYKISSKGNPKTKQVTELSPESNDISIIFPIEYNYDAFPQELNVFFSSTYQEKLPHASMSWVTPDGREIRIGQLSVRTNEVFRFDQDERLTRRLDGLVAREGLFADPNSETLVPLKGTYELHILGITFEPGSDIDAELVLYGQVHGLAGTDHRRRDLMVALLWGTPIALSFGLLAALGTTITTMIIAAIGVWFGGVVDGVIQRITEVVLILPLLPILIMVGTFYNRSLWLMLGVVILLSIFGSSIKTYRAIFLQVKESPYIEAARSYGAGNFRIIFSYMTPRIIPLLVPQLVILVPSFVFLEASLAVLGLGDPVLPTWGKMIDDAWRNGALFNGLYYWVLEPATLLMMTGFGFAMVGFALDRIFNPRLRGL